jgi:hypothetical protein
MYDSFTAVVDACKIYTYSSIPYLLIYLMDFPNRAHSRIIYQDLKRNVINLSSLLIFQVSVGSLIFEC